MKLWLGLISLSFGFAAIICSVVEWREPTRQTTLLTLVFSFISGLTFCIGMGLPVFWFGMVGGIGCAVFMAFAMWWHSYLLKTAERRLERLLAAQRQRRKLSK